MWPSATSFLLLGYLSLSKSFAYLGLPSLKVFIGEVVLGAFLVLRAGTFVGRWGQALVAPSALSAVVWAVFGFIGYGVFLTLYGIGEGYPAVIAFQNLAFNYYVLYFFLGLWVGERRPDLLERLVPILAWWNGVWGLLFILYFSRLPYVFPGTDVAVVAAPTGSAVALVALLAFQKPLRRVWPVLLLNAFVMLGLQVRAEWLSFMVGLLVWGALSRSLGRVAMSGVVLASLLVAMQVTEFSLPGPEGRGGSISIPGLLGRALAAVDADMAAQYNEQAAAYAGTVAWRTTWWREIWVESQRSVALALVGHGYGYPLSSLVPYLVGHAHVRTPHNVLFYALGYGGWLLAASFAFVQFALARLQWQAYRRTGQTFGAVCSAMGLTYGLFSNYFETPFNAIPFYLLLGLCAGSAGSARGLHANPPRP